MFKEYAPKIIIILAIGIAGVFMSSQFVACVSPPKKEDFDSEEAYSFNYCMFLNRANKDKSACTNPPIYLTDHFVQKRKIDLVEYCKKKENRFDNEDKERCYSRLNQK